MEKLYRKYYYYAPAKQRPPQPHVNVDDDPLHRQHIPISVCDLLSVSHLVWSLMCSTEQQQQHHHHMGYMDKYMSFGKRGPGVRIFLRIGLKLCKRSNTCWRKIYFLVVGQEKQTQYLFAAIDSSVHPSIDWPCLLTTLRCRWLVSASDDDALPPTLSWMAFQINPHLMLSLRWKWNTKRCN